MNFFSNPAKSPVLAKYMPLLLPFSLTRGDTTMSEINSGTGCIMNLASYLNGDKWITDAPACVDPWVRAVAVFLNDLSFYPSRQRKLIKMLPRMMMTGSLPEKDKELIRFKLASHLKLIKEKTLTTWFHDDIDRAVNVLTLNHTYYGVEAFMDALAYLYLARFTGPLYDLLDDVLPKSEFEPGMKHLEAEKIIKITPRHDMVDTTA